MERKVINKSFLLWKRVRKSVLRGISLLEGNKEVLCVEHCGFRSFIGLTFTEVYFYSTLIL